MSHHKSKAEYEKRKQAATLKKRRRDVARIKRLEEKEKQDKE